MKLEYRVHRANNSTVGKIVTSGEDVVKATVDSFEVELVGIKPEYGTITFKFVSLSEIKEAKNKFSEGAVVSWEI